jgi:hypothetical protein
MMIDFPELWLLGTAFVFTMVGYYMGDNAGRQDGIEMCLQAMISMKLVKIKTMPNGDEEIVAYKD